MIDVEVLMERVRSSSARSFVQEAITCYKAGAYRSCIVATWIALVYDFVDKFRELALSGDSSAKKLVKEFDRIQKERDTSAALKFEREVLDIAKDEYELLSSQECVDLRRLFEDRNRYGHPNLNQDLDALGASAELARSHLRHAVEHVMERPPVQGKVALQTIQAAVDSPYFPRDAEDAQVALSSTPLVRAKVGLIKDFFLGCIMSVICESLSGEVSDRRIYAAVATKRMHDNVVTEIIKTKIQVLLDKAQDKEENLGFLIVLLTRMPELISKVSPALRIKLKAYTLSSSDSGMSILNFAYDVDFLRDDVIYRLKGVSPTQLNAFVQRVARAPSRAVIDRSIEMLESSKSWDSSNLICAAISERMVDILLPSDANRILRAASNVEVKHSFSYPPLILKIIDKGLLEYEGVLKIAEEVGAEAVVNAIKESLADTSAE